jgi:catechol 2,3-dioxygenase-like lactoylglutathione lyase family enzyme
MKLEHVALNVAEPVRMAQWYVEHLGMRIVRAQEESPHAHFLVDQAGMSVIEIYNNPAAAVPDYASLHPLMLHFAFVVDDIVGVRDALLAAGGTAEGEIATNAVGDQLAFVRDPWHVPLQLVKRTTPLL